MKSPEVGELWSDEVAWAIKRKPRLILIIAIENGVARGRGIVGDGLTQAGVPVSEFAAGWSWQGYWSLDHTTLPTLRPPYEHHRLADIPNSRAAAKLHGTADLVNAIVPSLAPHSAYAYDRDRKALGSVDTDKPVSTIPPAAAYLELTFMQPRVIDRGTMARRPEQLLELWYQRQRNAWHLVRTLIVTSPHLLGDLRR